MRDVLVVCSDLHVGSTVGLCPPRVVLDDGGEYRYSPGQKWLWKYWRKTWRQIFEIAEGARLTVVVNGDLIEGDHHKTTQIWSKRLRDQAMTAVECLLIPANHADNMFVVRGTPTHVGESGNVEDDVAQELGCGRSHYHLEIDIQGVRFDIMHQGKSGPGKRKWTEGRQMRYALQSKMDVMLSRGDTPPRYVIRSHYHKMPMPVLERIEHRGKMYESEAFITPAWQLKTEFAHRVADGALSDIGLIYFEIENGLHHWKRIMRRFDTVERITL